MSELTVRPIGQTDYDAWRPLWDGYNAFYEREGSTALDPKITKVARKPGQSAPAGTESATDTEKKPGESP